MAQQPGNAVSGPAVSSASCDGLQASNAQHARKMLQGAGEGAQHIPRWTALPNSSPKRALCCCVLSEFVICSICHLVPCQQSAASGHDVPAHRYPIGCTDACMLLGLPVWGALSRLSSYCALAWVAPAVAIISRMLCRPDTGAGCGRVERCRHPTACVPTAASAAAAFRLRVCRPSGGACHRAAQLDSHTGSTSDCSCPSA